MCVTLGVIGILFGFDVAFFLRFWFSSAGGTRDRAGANEDTYLLLVISTGDVLSTYLRFSFLSEWHEAKPRTLKIRCFL